MLEDVTIDTDVLMHAGDPRQLFQEEIAETLQAVLASDTHLCLDARTVPAQGLIAAEYFSRLVPQSPGFTFVVEMISAQRIAPAPARAPLDVQRWINRQISNRRDRTFVAVAFNSSERVLCSDDDDDYPPATREALLERFDVLVCYDDELIERVR